MRKRRSLLLSHTALLAASAIMLVPLAWMVSTSLKQTGLGMSRGIEWPPWKDVYEEGAEQSHVVTLAGRVKLQGTGEILEVGVKSLA